MTDLRENLGWILGSIATAIAMAFGWIYESGILNTLVGIAIGAGIAYFVQTRTQKRAWKREYAVRTTEQVYGILFGDLKRIIEFLEKKYYINLAFLTWGEIQGDHRYFMVDEKFRKRLDEFSKRIETYNDACSRLEYKVFPKIMNAEVQRIFNVKPDRIANINVKYKEYERDSSTAPNIITCLKRGIHPIEDALENKDKAEISDVRWSISIQLGDGTTFLSERNSEKPDEFWKSCMRKIKEDKTYKFMIEENEKLLDETRKIRKKLVKRIEEPWKI